MINSSEGSYFTVYHENAKKHRTLFHYTSFDVLLKIINERRIKLSNITLLNDPVEYERLNDDPFIKNKIYVCCFNHFEKDTIPLWKMYADGLYGIRIGFPVNDIPFFYDTSNYEFGIIDNNITLNDKNPRRNWKVHSVSLIDVIYSDDIDKHAIADERQTRHAGIDAIAYTKRKCWDFEQETRIRVDLQPDGDLGAWIDEQTKKFEYAAPPYKNIYCRIPGKVLLNMRIMFSPKSNDLLVNMMKSEILRAIQGYQEGNFQRSEIRIK